MSKTKYTTISVPEKFKKWLKDQAKTKEGKTRLEKTETYIDILTRLFNDIDRVIWEDFIKYETAKKDNKK